MTYHITPTDYNLIATKARKNVHEEFLIPWENILAISAEHQDVVESLTQPRVYKDYKSLDKTIVISLQNEPQDKLVLEVSNPEEVINKIRAHIS